MADTHKRRLKEELSSILNDAFQEIVDGGKEDIRAYANDIAITLSYALMKGDSRLADELRFQLEAIAEVNRLRVVNESWTAVEKVVDLVMRSAAAAMVAAV